MISGKRACSLARREMLSTRDLEAFIVDRIHLRVAWLDIGWYSFASSFHKIVFTRLFGVFRLRLPVNIFLLRFVSPLMLVLVWFLLMVVEIQTQALALIKVVDKVFLVWHNYNFRDFYALKIL